MILGVNELHRLVKDKSLVENLRDRELNNPEGCGFDLRLGAVYEIQGQGYLGIEQRKTPTEKLLSEYDPTNKQTFIFEPGKYYLMKTIERINTPDNLAVLFRPRTTIFRSGMMIFTGNVAPGYKGELIFGITNMGGNPINIELGARVVHALFFEVKGSTNLYRGQWQDGRVSANQLETQV